MAPNAISGESNLPQVEEAYEKLVAPQAAPRKYQIVYFNVLYVAYWYLAAIYGFYLCLTSAKWPTIFFSLLLLWASQMGVSVGSHRLWSHKSFKANRALEIILIVLNSLTYQNTVAVWVRDHRLHHKYSDTDADPHNASRGIFFSHIGWVLVRKHPEVIKRGRHIDMSDIYSNPVVMFQKKYAVPFIGMLCFVLPTVIPYYFWEESLWNAWHIALMRFTMNLNSSFFVNSIAHRWGYRPYDSKKMAYQNNLLSVLTLGEGFHNYHHVFPSDYRSAESGNNVLNFATLFIDFFAWLGWATDLKTVSEDVIRNRSRRTGDGTDLWGNVQESNLQADKIINEE